MRLWGWGLVAALILGAQQGALILIDFLAHFAAHLAGLSLLAAAVFAARRRWNAAGRAAAAALVAAVGPLGTALAPQRISPDLGPDPAALTVAFANLDSNNSDIPAAARKLATLGADALILAETSMSLLDQPLARLYPHQVTRLRWVYGGMWIWSRLPVAAGWKQDVSPSEPAAAWARLALPGGGAIDLMGLQLRRPLLEQQATQLATLEAAPPDLRAPFVVGADLNAAPWSLAARRVARLFGAQMAGGLRWSWRSDLAAWLGPLAPVAALPLDHALASEGVALEAVETFAVPGSDHLGLLLRLKVARRAPGPDAPAPHPPVVF